MGWNKDNFSNQRWPLGNWDEVVGQAIETIPELEHPLAKIYHQLSDIFAVILLKSRSDCTQCHTTTALLEFPPELSQQYENRLYSINGK